MPQWPASRRTVRARKGALSRLAITLSSRLCLEVGMHRPRTTRQSTCQKELTRPTQYSRAPLGSRQGEFHLRSPLLHLKVHHRCRGGRCRGSFFAWVLSSRGTPRTWTPILTGLWPGWCMCCLNWVPRGRGEQWDLSWCHLSILRSMLLTSLFDRI